jgi:hypothetical protein
MLVQLSKSSVSNVFSFFVSSEFFTLVYPAHFIQMLPYSPEILKYHCALQSSFTCIGRSLWDFRGIMMWIIIIIGVLWTFTSFSISVYHHWSCWIDNYQAYLLFFYPLFLAYLSHDLAFCLMRWMVSCFVEKKCCFAWISALLWYLLM